MSASDIKTQYDRAIRRLVAEGRTAQQIVGAIGKGRHFVRARIKILGLMEASAVNGAAFQAAHRRTRKLKPLSGYGGWVSGMGRSIAVTGRRDDTASSLLVRVLRSDRDPDLLTDNAIACLHEGGLTLPDIEFAFGLPQAVTAAAIRRAHPGLHP